MMVYERGTIFCGRYTKEVPFLSKMVYKRVGVGILGGASQFKAVLCAPSFPLPQADIVPFLHKHSI